MIWGCFIKNKLDPLVVLEGKITEEVYKNLLNNHLLSFIESLDENISYSFQDDNAPVHRANLVLEWKEENLISSISWPAQSPDLNPIEHLWDHLGRKIYEHKPHPKNKKELIIILKEKWLEIENDYLKKLVNSMPSRIEVVIESKGNPTRY